MFVVFISVLILILGITAYSYGCRKRVSKILDEFAGNSIEIWLEPDTSALVFSVKIEGKEIGRIGLGFLADSYILSNNESFLILPPRWPNEVNQYVLQHPYRLKASKPRFYNTNVWVEFKQAKAFLKFNYRTRLASLVIDGEQKWVFYTEEENFFSSANILVKDEKHYCKLMPGLTDIELLMLIQCSSV